MPMNIRIFLTILTFAISSNLWADSWKDPTWKRMLDSSDIVALVKYISNGSERAKAKIVTSYKGHLKSGDEIWISGFSLVLKTCIKSLELYL